MSDVRGWVAVTREDGETVGYLEPVTDDYDLVQPRTLLGHARGAPVDFVTGEHLDAGTADEIAALTILELSPHGVVLADHFATKGLSATEKLHVAWPDLEERLSRR